MKKTLIGLAGALIGSVAMLGWQWGNEVKEKAMVVEVSTKAMEELNKVKETAGAVGEALRTLKEQQRRIEDLVAKLDDLQSKAIRDAAVVSEIARNSKAEIAREVVKQPEFASQVAESYDRVGERISAISANLDSMKQKVQCNRLEIVDEKGLVRARLGYGIAGNPNSVLLQMADQRGDLQTSYGITPINGGPDNQAQINFCSPDQDLIYVLRPGAKTGTSFDSITNHRSDRKLD